MNIIGLYEKVGMLIGNAERIFFHCVIRTASRVIEKLTGFNNFDQSFALINGMFVSLLLGIFFKKDNIPHKLWDEVVSDGSIIWMSMAVGVFVFSSEYILTMCWRRRRAFYEGRIKEAIMGSFSTDRFALALLTILAAHFFYHHTETEIRATAAVVPILYVALGLAKTEPYFSLQNQEKRVGGLLRSLGATSGVILIVLFGICFHRLPGTSVLIMMGALIFAILILHMISDIQVRKRSIHNTGDD